MRQITLITISAACLTIALSDDAVAQPLRDQAPGTWVKLSPLETTPPSPRLGYEGACAWDSWPKILMMRCHSSRLTRPVRRRWASIWPSEQSNRRNSCWCDISNEKMPTVCPARNAA